MAKTRPKPKFNPANHKKQLNRHHRAPGEPVDPDSLLRVDDVLRLIPISRSSWFDGVKAGRYPQRIKLGPHTSCWRARDILALSERAGTRPAAR